MKEKLMKEIQQAMNGKLSDRQKEQLVTAMRSCLQKYQISEPVSPVENTQEANNRLLTMFISAKQIEGCSGKTVIYYQETIGRFFAWIKKEITLIDTDDLRLYLAEYQQERNVSKVTIDNIRRILSSFFAWLEDEDYIVKSPVRRIHRIKTAKIIKEAFTDETIEVLRDTCSEIRNLAMVELLASSGMRVGELVKLNRTDINFNERSALFVSLRSPHKRLEIGGVEFLLRKLGRIAAIENWNGLFPNAGGVEDEMTGFRIRCKHQRINILQDLFQPELAF